MKIFLSFFIAILLIGCDGIVDLIDASISRTAKQTFISASGNAIEIKEANAVAPVRVPITIERLPNGQPTGAYIILLARNVRKAGMSL